MEEAVKANRLTTKGKRVAVKGKSNPFLATTDENEPDDHDFADCSDEFDRERKRLMEIWHCKQHPNQVCLASALCGHHKTIGFEGEMAWLLSIVCSLIHISSYIH